MMMMMITMTMIMMIIVMNDGDVGDYDDGDGDFHTQPSTPLQARKDPRVFGMFTTETANLTKKGK